MQFQDLVSRSITRVATFFVPAITSTILMYATHAYAATEILIYQFTNPSEGPPDISAMDSDGAIYGTIAAGIGSGGTVFRLSPPGPGQSQWQRTDLYTFCAQGQPCSDGSGPTPGLILDNLGAIYGVTSGGGAVGSGTVFTLIPPTNGQTSWTHVTLHDFCSEFGCQDGNGPFSLVADANGALFGLTRADTVSAVRNKKASVLFKLDPPAVGQTDWAFEAIFHFGNSLGVPFSGDRDAPLHLVSQPNGEISGVTGAPRGEPFNCTQCGMVFTFTPPTQARPHYVRHTSYSFIGEGNGLFPRSLITDASGGLFGAAAPNGCDPSGCGRIFKLAPNKTHIKWTYIPLYSFTGGVDGDYPQSLIWDPASGLYGLTPVGGGVGNPGGGGYGTIFKLTSPGPGQTQWTKSVIHSFGAISVLPFGDLIRDDMGAFFGTVSISGGATAVFKVTPD